MSKTELLSVLPPNAPSAVFPISDDAFSDHVTPIFTIFQWFLLPLGRKVKVLTMAYKMQCHLAPVHILISSPSQSLSSSCFSLNTTCTCIPQGLCTCCFLCLDCSSLRYLHVSFCIFFQFWLECQLLITVFLSPLISISFPNLIFFTLVIMHTM